MDSLCSSLRRVPAPSLAGGRLPDLVPLRSRSLVPIAIFPQLPQNRPNFGSQIEWNRMKCGTVIVPSAHAPSLFRGSSPQDGLTLEQVSFHDPGTSSSSSTSCRNGVPVFVMLPLDTVHLNNTLNTRIPLDSNFQALKAAGVEGIMTDVWWGVVEKDAPGHYNWSAYRKLFNLAKKHGLKVQAVMSFHQCGGNVGDNCFIPLPRWAIAEIDKNPDIVYTDRSRSRNYEYLSLGCDDLPVLQGRSPVQAYADFMASFRKTFEDLLGDVIVEIQVGMGPAGELRYPAYPPGEGRWSFPGIGEFQCYDRFMMSSLQAAAAAAGRPEWGYAGPHDAGTYNQWPQDTGFFHNDGSWTMPYGHFFLDWYSGMLIGHGDRVLSAARAVFAGTGAHISGKVAGVHWHYGSRSHAAELTAGYYNTRSRDGYRPVAEMFARHGAGLNFTCVEMRDTHQPAHLQCGPEGLLRQVAAAAEMAGLEVSGENALPRFDQDGFDHIVWNAVHRGAGATMRCFTLLRMCEELFRMRIGRLSLPS